MNLEAMAMLAAGVLLFAGAAATMREDREAPKDWRFWAGTAVSTIGAGVAIFGALMLLESR